MITFVGCSRGNVRSVTCAAILKDLYGMSNVVTFGVDVLDGDGIGAIRELPISSTRIIIVGDMDLLTRARDIEIYMDGSPTTDLFLDIGPDIWGIAGHPRLVSTLLNAIASDEELKQLVPVNYPSAEAYLAAHIAVWERAHES